MITSPRFVLAAAAAGLMLSSVGASSAPLPTPALAVAPPQAAVVGFAGPVVVAVQGQALSFANTDVVGHTLTSTATRGHRIRYGKKWYTIQVPLFDSGNVGSTGIGDVKGVASLAPGSYTFYCQVHTSMKGTLVVEAAG